jgi:AAA+ ATPase superfamily predicted ATPase
LNEISTKIGEDSAKTVKYIDTLINLKIVYKEYPFGDNPEKSRKGIYKIYDNCFRFWYRHVFPERTAIEQGAGRAVLQSLLPGLSNYIGYSFEDICHRYMIAKNNRAELPFLFTRSGRWWGNNPKKRSEEEIDIVFSTSNGRDMIFAECKWRNEAQDVSAINQLIEKSGLFSGCESRYYYLFSKAGFSKSCRALADEAGNIELIALCDLFSLL